MRFVFVGTLCLLISHDFSAFCPSSSKRSIGPLLWFNSIWVPWCFFLEEYAGKNTMNDQARVRRHLFSLLVGDRSLPIPSQLLEGMRPEEPQKKVLWLELEGFVIVRQRLGRTIQFAQGSGFATIAHEMRNEVIEEVVS